MAIVNLLLDHPGSANLNDVAAHLDRALGGLALDERSSENYVDERYLAGDLGTVRIAVALSDETDHDDLPYWVMLRSESASEADLVAHVDDIARQSLVPHGFRVARFVGFGRKDEQRIDYPA